MTPLEIIGLVSAIITFIDFAAENVTVAGEIGRTGSATFKDNADLERRVKLVEEHITGLNAKSIGAPRDTNEAQLLDLVEEYKSLTVQLMTLLAGLKSTKKRHILSKMVKDFRKKDEKETLQKELDDCRSRIHLQLTQLTRSELSRRLDEISVQGHINATEMQQLGKNIEELQSSVELWKHVPGLVESAHDILSRSKEAVESTAQRLILEKLYVGDMTRRFDEIERAHEKTFSWLLSSCTPSTSDFDSSDGSESSHSDGSGHVSRGENESPNEGSQNSDQFEVPGAGTSSDDSSYEDSDYQPQILLERTARELQAQQDLIDWLARGGGIFHISGKPGAGKSTLMKYLCQTTATESYLKEWAGEKTLILANFFFWKLGSTAQKSSDGLLRALSYSILEQAPALLETVFPKQWRKATQGEAFSIQSSEIEWAFSHLLRQTAFFSSHKIAIFIDGLDEFDGDHDKLIKMLRNWSKSVPEDIKLMRAMRTILLAAEKERDHTRRQNAPLSLTELAFLDDYEKDPNFVFSFPATKDATGSWASRQDRVRRLVYQRCMGLLEVQSPRGDDRPRLMRGVCDFLGLPLASEQITSRDENKYKINEDSNSEIQSSLQNGTARIHREGKLEIIDEADGAFLHNHAWYNSPHKLNDEHPSSELVVCTHRSVFEFLSQPHIISLIDAEAQSFDLADFRLQAFLASLKLFRPCKWFVTRNMMATIKHFVWICFVFRELAQDRLLTFCEELLRILKVQTPTPSIGPFIGPFQLDLSELHYAIETDGSLGIAVYVDLMADSWPISLDSGFYQLGRRSKRDMYHNMLLDFCLPEIFDFFFEKDWTKTSYEMRTCEYISKCFEAGADPNGLSLLTTRSKMSLTCWQAWMIVFIANILLFKSWVPYLRLFLLHGADPIVWVHVESDRIFLWWHDASQWHEASSFSGMTDENDFHNDLPRIWSEMKHANACAESGAKGFDVLLRDFLPIWLQEDAGKNLERGMEYLSMPRDEAQLHFTTTDSAQVEKMTVGAAILRHDTSNASILLLKRNCNEEHYPDVFEIPGGKVDATDSTIRDAIVREVAEETQMKVLDITAPLPRIRYATEKIERTSAGQEKIVKRHALQLSYVVTVEGTEFQVEKKEHSMGIWATRDSLDQISITSDMRKVVLEALDVAEGR
ncbi:hypothetical protein CMEL01_08059 [Colletotrichum melonis]|uniref:Nudix hydrolase domain-containing protein n=1 Tax=Colletotrichum melonis TaxID=1209925 RepID=A0AAI9TZ93_9PEZI|nr:hypothetical protein CMEL01_08059 [Colletotrichum melonis]